MKRKKCFFSGVLFFLLGLALLFVAGCRREGSSDDRRLKVVATTGMITDAVHNIGGVQVAVQGLMGPGVDPHLYKATAEDTRRLAEAKLILYNGLHLEGKMQSILEKMARRRQVIAVTEKIPRSLLRKTNDKSLSAIYDPHVWFDVSLWKRAVQRIGEALVQADPPHAALYRSRLKVYLQKLDQLHRWVQEQIATIPPERRYLITSHDAFGYFGQAYKVRVIGLQGISTVSEAGVKDVERIVELVVREKIYAIFVETSVSNRSLRSVVQACRAQGHKVKIGGALFSDAMGQAGTPEGTYLGMVRHNVQTIVQALAPSAKRAGRTPPRGAASGKAPSRASLRTLPRPSAERKGAPPLKKRGRPASPHKAPSRRASPR